MSRKTTKRLYYFNGGSPTEDERMTLCDVKKHKSYRKLLNFLLSKRNGKRDI